MEEENTIKILVASDVHLGYKEKDTRADQDKDSFNSFEEVFQIARDKNADFVLLGGDLFHENKPSSKTLHSCMEIMKKYCLGDRPCQVRVLGDQAAVFGHTSKTVKTVNYEDPNIHISMPVFSIHGNHDDPAGAGSPSAIDLLSVAGYLNHFGRTTNLNNIEITPVKLQKGSTKIALYGLGAIRDERLHRMFEKNNVKFIRPEQDTNEWFNIMVIHQNRVKRGQKNYIPEEFLDKFLDLVIWGHEHECIGSLEPNNAQKFLVLQPGSTVATSLSQSESKKKHVVLLKLCKREMEAKFIELKTVRNMYVKDIPLKKKIPDPSVSDIEKIIQKYCEEEVEIYIERAGREMSGHPKQPDLPLIRLRIDYSGGYPMFSPSQFGARFVGRVANHNTIIRFLRKSDATRADQDMKDLDKLIDSGDGDRKKMEDFVQEYLEKENSLSLLSAQMMTLTVQRFVEKKYTKEEIHNICKYQVDKTLDHIKANCPNALENGDIIEGISRYKEQRKAQGLDNEESVQAILERALEQRRTGSDDSDVSSSKISGSKQEAKNKTQGGRGGHGGTRGRGRGRGLGRDSKTCKAAIPVETTSARSMNIKDEAMGSKRESRLPEAIVISSDSDDSTTQTMDPTTSQQPRRSPSKRAWDGRYDSDENPFMSTSSGKKKR